MGNLIAKVRSKNNVPPGAIQGKYRKGKITKKYSGPKKGKFILNPHQLKLRVAGRTEDGKRVVGSCIIKYDISAADYLESLNATEERVEELEKKLSEEASYDLSGIISQYSSQEIQTDEAKRELESEIEKRSKVTFLKKGIEPYKITSKWQIRSETVNLQGLEKHIEGALEELESRKDDPNISELIKEKARETARRSTMLSSYIGSVREYLLNELFEKIYERVLLSPGKKPSEYVSSAEFKELIEEAQEKGPELLFDQNA